MLIFTESFDFLPGFFNTGPAPSHDKWNLNSGVQCATGGRTGQYLTTNAGSTDHIARRVDAGDQHATFIVGFAITFNSNLTSAARRLLSVTSDSDSGEGSLTTHITAQTQTDGSIKVFRGTTAGTLLGQTAAGVVTNTGTTTWRYIELKVTLHDTAGVVVLRVDETAVLTLSGIDTKNGGTKTVLDSFLLDTGFFSMDDVYLCNGAGSGNNDFLGAIRILCRHPTGNGATSGMTNSAGNSTNNYSYVDDTFPSPDTSDYVDGVTTGDKDTYAFAASGDAGPTQPTGNSVKGVAVYAWAQKTDAGARGLSLVARSGGTETVTASVGPALVNGAYHHEWAIFETKPAGGGWTVGDVNAGEFGMQAS